MALFLLCYWRHSSYLFFVNARAEEANHGSEAPMSGPPLFTIGYGARSFDQFLAVLQSNSIEYLIDVRTAPYSKFKPEFSRDVLRGRIERAGIRYIFMGDTLGGQPSDLACQTEGKIDYSKVRLQPFFQEGLERLKKAFAQQHRAALMCSEGRPEQCHRSKLIAEALADAGIPVRHIDEDGSVLTHSEVIRRLTGGQMDLFGPTPFSSRKRYPTRDPNRPPGELHEDGPLPPES